MPNKNEVVTLDQSPPAVQESKISAVMETLRAVCINPDVDVDKMAKIMEMQITLAEKADEMQEKKDKEAARIEFSRSLSALKADMPQVTKSKYNGQTESWFATLGDIAKACDKVIADHGFALSFRGEPTGQEGWIREVMDVHHVSGHMVTTSIDVPVDDKGIKGTVNKTPIHAIASAKSYAKRYLKAGFLDIATEDNDGNTQEAVEDITKVTDETFKRIEKYIRGRSENDRQYQAKFEKFTALFEVEDIREAHDSVVVSFLDQLEKSDEKS